MTGISDTFDEDVINSQNVPSTVKSHAVNAIGTGHEHVIKRSPSMTRRYHRLPNTASRSRGIR